MHTIRIDNATPKDPSLPLCASCKSCWTQRDSSGNIMRRCTAAGHPAPLITAKIVECSSFYPHNEPWLMEYESLAWLWSSGEKGEPAFVRLRDLEQGLAIGPPRAGFGR
jgi:hypothetical protein